MCFRIVRTKSQSQLHNSSLCKLRCHNILTLFKSCAAVFTPHGRVRAALAQRLQVISTKLYLFGAALRDRLTAKMKMEGLAIGIRSPKKLEIGLDLSDRQCPPRLQRNIQIQ